MIKSSFKKNHCHPKWHFRCQRAIRQSAQHLIKQPHWAFINLKTSNLSVLLQSENNRTKVDFWLRCVGVTVLCCIWLTDAANHPPRPLPIISVLTMDFFFLATGSTNLQQWRIVDKKKNETCSTSRMQSSFSHSVYRQKCLARHYRKCHHTASCKSSHTHTYLQLPVNTKVSHIHTCRYIEDHAFNSTVVRVYKQWNIGGTAALQACSYQRYRTDGKSICSSGVAWPVEKSLVFSSCMPWCLQLIILSSQPKHMFIIRTCVNVCMYTDVLLL